MLANYPNPFNPETWIPYQLAEPADVTLTIYDIHGRVVRNIDLGHQRAGMYHGRSRAAYWDGRNAQGEPVASGLYFYTLKAGDFIATRKNVNTEIVFYDLMIAGRLMFINFPAIVSEGVEQSNL